MSRCTTLCIPYIITMNGWTLISESPITISKALLPHNGMHAYIHFLLYYLKQWNRNKENIIIIRKKCKFNTRANVPNIIYIRRVDWVIMLNINTQLLNLIAKCFFFQLWIYVITYLFSGIRTIILTLWLNSDWINH